MTSPGNVIGMAAARDLGVGGMGDLTGMSGAAAQEEMRKKKLLMDQQANGKAVAPFTGAFMSLTGNQF